MVFVFSGVMVENSAGGAWERVAPLYEGSWFSRVVGGTRRKLRRRYIVECCAAGCGKVGFRVWRLNAQKNGVGGTL